MVEKPEIGAAYWTYDEFWGVLIAFRVKLTRLNTEPHRLYMTEPEAREAMRRERERIEIERYEGRL